eukprot:ANDGO_05731.mRNA.1 hypothetical protein
MADYWVTAKRMRETAALYVFSEVANQWVLKLQDTSGRAGFLSCPVPDSSLPCQERKPSPGPSHHDDDDDKHTGAIVGVPLEASWDLLRSRASSGYLSSDVRERRTDRLDNSFKFLSHHKSLGQLHVVDRPIFSSSP